MRILLILIRWKCPEKGFFSRVNICRCVWPSNDFDLYPQKNRVEQMPRVDLTSHRVMSDLNHKPLSQ